MTEVQLSAILEGITGQLIAQNSEQRQQLQKARQKLAASLLHQPVEATGIESSVLKSGLATRINLSKQTLKDIGTISRKAVSSAASTSSSSEIAFIRTESTLSNLATSKPSWAVGVEPSVVFGPFKNIEGKEIWFDFYQTAQLVTFYIGSQPVLLFRTTIRRTLVNQKPQISFSVLKGSIWINTQLLRNGTKQDGLFVGLLVENGTVNFSLVPTIDNNSKIRINPASIIDVSLNLQQEEKAFSPEGFGVDAAHASYQLPKQFSFSRRANRITISQAGPASCNIFGESVNFSFAPVVTQPKLAENYLLIPWKPNVNTFQLKTYKSSWTEANGKALLNEAYWALPTTMLNVDNPVVVTGNGSVQLHCGKGIAVSWTGLKEGEVNLINPVITGRPEELSIADASSRGLGANHSFLLWEDEKNPYGTTAELSLRNSAPFKFVSYAKMALELVSITGKAALLIDRPVKVDGQPFPVDFEMATLSLVAQANIRAVQVKNGAPEKIADANEKITDPKDRQSAIALENALIRVSAVEEFHLVAQCTPEYDQLLNGQLQLNFNTGFYIPTLPDPYVSNMYWNMMSELRGTMRLPISCFISFSDKEEQKVKVNFYCGEMQSALAPSQIQDDATAISAQPQNSLSNAGINITESHRKEIEKINHGKVTPDIGAIWNNTINANSDPILLLDVSSNANQMGVSFGGKWDFIRTGKIKTDDNGSTVDHQFPITVEGMQVKMPATHVRAFTLPLMAWEPQVNLTAPDRENPSDPKLGMDPERGLMYYADDGGPARFWNNNAVPVPLAPIPVTNQLISAFKLQPDNYTIATITLPFGMKAVGFISQNFVEPQDQKPSIENIQPKFRKNEETNSYKLEGGIQMSLKAGKFGKPHPTDLSKFDSPMFPGYVIQTNNLLNLAGIKTLESNLGHRVTEIFNNEFLIGPLSLDPTLKASRGVPVSRIDITGYGANMFSNWISPGAALAQTSQARFDVMLGRTGHEVVQVKSILYPWGIRVVRTITVFRSGSGIVFRTDSGWKAESDGLFDFGYSYLKAGKDPFGKLVKNDFETKDAPYEFHTGIVRGLYNIRNIKDAPSVTEYLSENVIEPNTDYLNGVKGQIFTNGSTRKFEPVKCGGVYFDADIEIENVVQGHVNKRVVSKRILGYVQVAPAGKPLTSQQLRALLHLQNGSIGGDIDCVLDVNQSGQQIRAARFDVNVSVATTGEPAFAVAVRGNIILPKDGSWSMIQHHVGSGEVTPLPKDTMLPLIREGKWEKYNAVNNTTLQNKLVRVAHPMELLRPPTNDTINFGYLQATATQKALFLTPSYGYKVDKLLSKTPPVFADAYRLMTGEAIFPNIGNAMDNFGKAMPLLNAKDANGNSFAAFAQNTLRDGGQRVWELLKVETEKAGNVVISQGLNLLKQGANGVLNKALQFDVPSFEVPLVDTDALKIYIDYKTGKKGASQAGYISSKLDFDVNSFTQNAAEQWKSRLNNVAMVVDLGDMKRLITIKGNFDAKKGSESGFAGGPENNNNGLPTPEIEFSDALQPVVDILQMLASLSTGNYKEVLKKGLKIAMSNSGEIWQYKFEATKEIANVRFPPTDELYNSAQTPLKLEASLSTGVRFNAALKVTTDPSQLLPTAGAFLQFNGGLQVMCASVGAGSVYAVGAVEVRIAADTSVGPSLGLKFGFGVSVVVSLPVIGSVSVTFMVGVEMYADKQKVIIAAMMLFRGRASLAGGLVCVTITIEAKGIMERQSNKTTCIAQITFGLDISIFLVINISFSRTWSEGRQIA